MVIREEDKDTCSATEHHVCLCIAVELVLGVLECFSDVLVAQLRILCKPRICGLGRLDRLTIIAGIVAAPDTRQEPIAHDIAISFRLLAVHYFVVLINYIRELGSLYQVGQDQRQALFYERRYLMSVDTVAIHHTDHPQILNPCKILLIKVGILINFSHLRNEACPCLVGNPFNDLMVRTPCLVLNLDWFIIGSSLHRHCLLVLSYVDASEV